MAKVKKLTNGDDTFVGKGGPDNVLGLGGNDKISGGAGDDKLNGGAGNDTLNGDSGDDTLIGGAGNDTMNGGSGDDMINANVGDDIVDGGTGIDTVSVLGNKADAVVTKTATGYTIKTATNTVTISNVETVKFADGSFDVTTLVPPTPTKLTAGTDTIAGTSGNDVIEGAAGTLNATDVIIDTSTTDSDQLNVTLTAINGAAKVSGIEAINVNWDSFAAAAVDAANFAGGTINISTTKVGALGNATVTGVTTSNVTAGTGMKGALSVTGSAATTDVSTVNAGAAATATVSGIETLTVKAGAATTSITASVYNTATIDAGTATSVSLTEDAATDKATLKVGADTALTYTNAGGTLALDIAAGKTVTMTGNIGASLSVTGTGDATVKMTAAALTGKVLTETVTGKLTVEATTGGALDVTKADADVFVLAAGLNTVTALTGDNFSSAGDIVASTFTVAGAGTSDALSLTLSASQTGAISFTGVETATITSAAKAVTGTDITYASLVNTGNSIILKGTNDVVVTSVTAATLDASALVGDLTVTTAPASTTVSVIGATGANTATFDAAATNASFIGQGGVDTVTFGTAGAAGNVYTAVTAGGNDVITASVGALTSVAGGSLSIDAGAGNDTINLNGVVAGTTGTLVLAGGDGTDTLVLGVGANLTGANLTLVSIETIDVDNLSTFNGSQLSGAKYAITGNGAGTSTVTVTGTNSADTINLGSLVVTDSASTGVKFAINGIAGDDVITGSASTDTITGGTGIDTMTGGALADTFVFSTGDSGITAATADVITDFATGIDKLDFTSGTLVASYSEGAAAVADFAAALAAANTAMTGDAVDQNAQQVGTDVWVFVDSNNDNAADMVVKLTGVTLATIAAGDFL